MESTEVGSDPSVSLSSDHPVQCLVINGGGANVFRIYGEMRAAAMRGQWHPPNIRSYYGTSAGAVLSLLFAMQLDWKTMDKFVVHRPWHQLFKFNVLNLYDYYTKNGVFGNEFFVKLMAPLFNARDIPLDATFRELGQALGGDVDFHFYSTRLRDMKPVEFSTTATPDMKVLDALHASCCLPLLYQPFSMVDAVTGMTEWYTDGGFFCNFPLFECMATQRFRPEEVIGVQNLVPESNLGVLNAKSTMIDTLSYLLNCWLDATQDTRIHEARTRRRPEEMDAILASMQLVTVLRVEAIAVSYTELFRVASDEEERERVVFRPSGGSSSGGSSGGGAVSSEDGGKKRNLDSNPV